MLTINLRFLPWGIGGLFVCISYFPTSKMKNKDLQDQFKKSSRKAYYTMTYTGDDPAEVVNFEAERNIPAKRGGSALAKLTWLAILAGGGAFAYQHFMG